MKTKCLSTTFSLPTLHEGDMRKDKNNKKKQFVSKLTFGSSYYSSNRNNQTKISL